MAVKLVLCSCVLYVHRVEGGLTDGAAKSALVLQSDGRSFLWSNNGRTDRQTEEKPFRGKLKCEL